MVEPVTVAAWAKTLGAAVCRPDAVIPLVNLSGQRIRSFAWPAFI